jgi:hypothetical protein
MYPFPREIIEHRQEEYLKYVLNKQFMKLLIGLTWE